MRPRLGLAGGGASGKRLAVRKNAGKSGFEVVGRASARYTRRVPSGIFPPPRPRRRRRSWWWRLGLILVLTLTGLTLAVLIWLREAIFHHWVTFPRQAAASAGFAESRRPVSPLPGWTEYRGILHSHSEQSHDSEVPFPEIQRALEASGTDFIALSDHCDEGRGDFSRQWRGLHGDRLFIPGFEMKEGLMPFGVAREVVVENRMPAAEIARTVVQQGGVLFYAHPEEPREWDRAELTGMEIYNIHADFKQLKHPLLTLIPELLVNNRRYPDQVFRSIFRRPEENLRRWDELNRGRHLTGIAGNDCHQNTGVRGIWTEAGTLRIEDTSPRTLKEWRPGAVGRTLLRWLGGPLEPGREVFHVQLDPYPRMARYVGTHVLAQELTEAAVLDSLRAGRAFVAFDLLADGRGFLFWAESTDGTRTLMGERRKMAPGLRLEARSPIPCRFRVVRDGGVVHEESGRDLTWVPAGPGLYRVEAELPVAGVWTPWIYANPIRIE